MSAPGFFEWLILGTAAAVVAAGAILAVYIAGGGKKGE